jgi:hypothetical protein
MQTCHGKLFSKRSGYCNHVSLLRVSVADWCGFTVGGTSGAWTLET